MQAKRREAMIKNSRAIEMSGSLSSKWQNHRPYCRHRAIFLAFGQNYKTRPLIDGPEIWLSLPRTYPPADLGIRVDISWASS